MYRGEDLISYTTRIAANEFADFFDKKVNDIRAATDGGPLAEFVDTSNIEQLLNSTPFSIDDVIKQVNAQTSTPAWIRC